MAFTDFYRQARWIKLRKALKFERVNAEGLLLCEHCGKPILKDYDAILHHKSGPLVLQAHKYQLTHAQLLMKIIVHSLFI